MRRKAGKNTVALDMTDPCRAIQNTHHSWVIETNGWSISLRNMRNRGAFLISNSRKDNIPALSILVDKSRHGILLTSLRHELKILNCDLKVDFNIL